MSKIGQNEIKITKEGLDALKNGFQELCDTKRPKLVERLAHARSQGDLTENSDYHNAKDELEFLDGRIAELEDVLKNSVVVKPNEDSNGGVSIGAQVTLRSNGKEHVFCIVGEWEANPVKKKISHTSPLGSALVGKRVGEKAEVEAPVGKIVYEILSID